MGTALPQSIEVSLRDLVEGFFCSGCDLLKIAGKTLTEERKRVFFPPAGFIDWHQIVIN
jgi:hypothetical protein